MREKRVSVPFSGGTGSIVDERDRKNVSRQTFSEFVYRAWTAPYCWTNIHTQTHKHAPHLYKKAAILVGLRERHLMVDGRPFLSAPLWL